MTRTPWNEPGDRFDKALAAEERPEPTRCPCLATCECKCRLAGQCECHDGGDGDGVSQPGV
jgi:hypothetical protein